MKIDRISQIFGMDLQKVANGGKSPDKTEKPAKSDSVTLSKKAKELSSSSTEVVAGHIRALPDVRADKVQEAKEKIASGYFNSPDFEEKLADRLMKDFGF
ncbi:MAG: flagellar biosynthesis anti-sigma factor FlgM [Fibrobacteria bacterium]|jgi:flagellar biosynthesis anti-sigma factor FlgM